MSAAQGGFQFAAINAADVQGLSTAVIAQLQVFSNHISTMLTDLIREPDISQDLEGRAQDIKASLEMQLAVAFAEINNRITRAEMRNEEIAQAGNRVVADMGAWTTQTKAEIHKTSLELDNVIQQAQVKFLDVEASQQQLRSQDMESLKSDFRTFASQSDHRFQTFEARLDALALSAVSTAQEDPWHRSQTPWSGGAGAAPRSSSQEGAAQSGFPGADDLLNRWYTDKGPPRPAPVIPPGFPELQPASQQTWKTWPHDNYARSEFRPDLRNWKEAQLDLSVKPEIFKAWQPRIAHAERRPTRCSTSLGLGGKAQHDH